MTTTDTFLFAIVLVLFLLLIGSIILVRDAHKRIDRLSNRHFVLAAHVTNWMDK